MITQSEQTTEQRCEILEQAFLYWAEYAKTEADLQQLDEALQGVRRSNRDDACAEEFLFEAHLAQLRYRVLFFEQRHQILASTSRRHEVQLYSAKRRREREILARMQAMADPSGHTAILSQVAVLAQSEKHVQYARLAKGQAISRLAS